MYQAHKQDIVSLYYNYVRHIDTIKIINTAYLAWIPQVEFTKTLPVLHHPRILNKVDSGADSYKWPVLVTIDRYFFIYLIHKKLRHCCLNA